MIRLEDVTKQYRGREVLSGITLTIAETDRIGLVGGNGAGKSTLLRILAGELTADEGNIVKKKGLRIGYLPQSNAAVPRGTVFEACVSVRRDLEEKKARIDAIEKQLETAGDGRGMESALSEYHRLWSEFSTLGGLDLKAQTARVLAGLGFKEADYERPVCELSGGWKMRLALAGLLLQRPDIMLLDEPTNHLDIEARNWLLGYLNEGGTGYVLVSHDRYFLDVTTQRTLELRAGKIDAYPCPYSRYIIQAEEKARLQEKIHAEQVAEIEKLKRFIRKFHAQPAKASQVRDRVKKLERIELVAPPREQKTIRFRFPQPPRCPRTLVSLEHVSKAYGDLVVFHDLDGTIERGDRIALVGPNGVGKSTLMRILAKLEPIDRGRMLVTPGVASAYFSQDTLQSLTRDRTVFDELASVARIDLIPRLRTLLGGFLFRGDDVEKRVGVLSGGEMTRLAVAKLLLQPVHLILLDEPTNNLDIPSMEALIHALGQFQGCLVFVSHDRYFINALANKVAWIEDGRLAVHPGDYDDFLRFREAHGSRVQVQPVRRGNTQDSPPSRGKEEWEQRKRARAEVKAAERELSEKARELERIEAAIGELERAIKHTEDRLAEASVRSDADTLRSASAEHKRLKADLEKLFWDWEETSSSIEEIQGKLDSEAPTPSGTE